MTFLNQWQSGTQSLIKFEIFSLILHHFFKKRYTITIISLTNTEIKTGENIALFLVNAYILLSETGYFQIVGEICI